MLEQKVLARSCPIEAARNECMHATSYSSTAAMYNIYFKSISYLSSLNLVEIYIFQIPSYFTIQNSFSICVLKPLKQLIAACFARLCNREKNGYASY